MNNFKFKLEEYRKKVQFLSDKHWTDYNFKHAQSPLIVLEEGTRYIKVLRQERRLDGHLMNKSIHTFIDKTNGDILKAASYKAPQKNGVRGNIFTSEIESVVDHYGAIYLR